MSKAPATPPVKKRVFVVDDHAVVREGLTILINNQTDLEVCGEASNAPDAVRGLEDAHADIVLVDISLKGTNGLELIRNIRTLYNKLPALVLSAHEDTRYAERAFRAGAMGYVMKDQQSEVLVDAIRRVLAGKIFLRAELMPEVLAAVAGKKDIDDGSPFKSLSDRELEVFQLLGQGIQTRSIAETLRLQPKTVHRYRENIKMKLGLNNATELLHAAYDWVNNKTEEEV
ncbi:TPA: DNA-binding response regulator [Candidatus Sumerlaeota bacterium]|jgi:DNA-binding NarL/FixJ family response regulator|nr:DNA-binding response regulator [Candidatus Sumerlaeota bacterium]